MNVHQGFYFIHDQTEKPFSSSDDHDMTSRALSFHPKSFPQIHDKNRFTFKDKRVCPIHHVPGAGNSDHSRDGTGWTAMKFTTESIYDNSLL